MRYPEDKIKEAILHPDIETRDRAVSYFARSFSTDTSLMRRSRFGRRPWTMPAPFLRPRANAASVYSRPRGSDRTSGSTPRRACCSTESPSARPRETPPPGRTSTRRARSRRPVRRMMW
jgi:hypothetical protein